MTDYQRPRQHRHTDRKNIPTEKINDGIFTVTFAQLLVGVLIVLTVYLFGFFKSSVFIDISEQYNEIISDKQVFYQLLDVIYEKTGIDTRKIYIDIKNAISPQEMQNAGAGGMLLVSQSDEDAMQAPSGMSLAPLFLTAQAKSPLKECTVTSEYGFRIHPISGKNDFHTGIDLAAPMGEKISAIYPGKVKECGESDVYGLYVVIEHANGLESVYNHCSEIKVSEGTVIRQGETVALVGSTGISTGPHLHLDIRVNGINYDPIYALGTTFSEQSDDISV